MKIALKYRLLLLLICVSSLFYGKVSGLGNYVLFDLAAFAFKFSIIALCYVTLLIEPEMILGGWRRFVEDTVYHFVGRCTPRAGMISDAILKAVLYCEVCITGQFALWGFLLFNTAPYNFVNHLFVVCISMLITQLIKELFL